MDVTALQWGHDLSAVETPRAIGARSPSSGFNGATTFQPWKLARNRTRFGRCVRFNGATTFQPWKLRPAPSMIGDSQTSFNGATTFQPWKHELTIPGPSRTTVLQWGHDLSAVETGAGPPVSSVTVGGLQWGHDLSAVETRNADTRKPRSWVASMGPRPFSRGNTDRDSREPKSEVASMGPRPFSRGNRDEASAVHLSRHASMGPRPFSRGNHMDFPQAYICHSGFNGATTFQPWKLLRPALDR